MASKTLWISGGIAVVVGAAAFMQRVQIFIRPPPEVLGSATHWRLGYLRVLPVGLNFVARTRFEYFPATRVPFSQMMQIFVVAMIYFVPLIPHQPISET